MSKSASQKQAEGNILTFLRIRPSKNPSGWFSQDDLDQDTLNFTLPDNFKSDYINNSKLKHGFHFNGIIPMAASQEDVFKKVGSAAVQNALEGFNSTIFAYGQTGSGKTFTITGGPERYSDRGIIPRAISMIYNEFRSRTDVQAKMYISYLELYNEQGYDLLDPSHETKSLEDLQKVTILEDEFGNFHLKNLTMHPSDNEEDALNLLFLGDTNRAIAETPMNMASSRSHCIFTISMEIRQSGSETVRRSKLHLVDLAGSERVAKTNSSGSVLTEAKYINTSLFFLEMVIVALYEKATKGRQHVPYRNSMMTSVLRDSLGGNCKTIMIATINPEASHTDESLSTCRFAQRVSLIKNKATLNQETDPLLVIKKLKEEVLSLREEIVYLKGEAGEGELLTPQESEDLRAKCRTYVDDPAPNVVLNIGKLTLSKIKDAFSILKSFVLEARTSSSSSNNGSNDSKSLDSARPTAQTEALQKEIRDLKSCLLQRDTEIAILVNMVKKGKNEAGISSGGSGSANNFESSSGASEDRRHSYAAAPSESKETRNLQNYRNNSPRAAIASTAMAQSQEKDYAAARGPVTGTGAGRGGGVSAAASLAREREERIVKRHLFGVPPPDDIRVLDDPQASFEYFRVRSESHGPIEENKEQLRLRYAEAKTLGERANHSRNTITYLKTSIEGIRRERALQNISNGSKQLTDDDDEGGGEETEEERTYRRAIEQEKTVYKESFDKLRTVKPEIEHIRKILEKSRNNLQTQFDQWYNNLLNRLPDSSSSSSSSSSTNNNNSASLTQFQLQQHQQQFQGAHLASTASLQSIPAMSKAQSQSIGSTSHDYSTMSSSTNAGMSASDQKFASSSSSSAARRAWGTPEPSPVYAKSDRGINGAESSGTTALPPLTGNKEADEDIMAFYKAKEELLKRRANQAPHGSGLPTVSDSKS